MNHARSHSNALILPDRTVLMVGGGQNGLYDSPVLNSELYDPVTEEWTLLPAQVFHLDLAESLRRVEEEGGKLLKTSRGRDGEYAYAAVEDPIERYEATTGWWCPTPFAGWRAAALREERCFRTPLERQTPLRSRCCFSFAP